jgi:hypothetical protein
MDHGLRLGMNYLYKPNFEVKVYVYVKGLS